MLRLGSGAALLDPETRTCAGSKWFYLRQQGLEAQGCETDAPSLLRNAPSSKLTLRAYFKKLSWSGVHSNCQYDFGFSI